MTVRTGCGALIVAALVAGVLPAQASPAQAASATTSTASSVAARTAAATLRLSAPKTAAAPGQRVRTTGTVAVVAKKKGATRTVKVTLTPATGKAKTVRVKARWSASKARYVGAYTFLTTRTGKVSARADGARTVTRTASAPTSKIRGWSATPVSMPTGAGVTDKVTVTPAYGRTVQVQVLVNGAWKTRTQARTATSARTATLTIKIPAGTPGATARWRLRVTSGAAKAAVTKAKAVTTRTTTPTSTPVGTPSPAPTPTPAPSPAPGGCGGTDTLGKAFTCDDVQVYSVVLDRLLPAAGQGCGVTRV